MLFVSLTTSGVIYGGIHVLAWDGPLHSQFELLLWRIAAISVIAGSGFLSAWWALVGVSGHLDFRYGKALWWRALNDLGYVLSAPLVFCAAALYVLARIYLVVESFISLPYSVDGVYLQPQWSRYFPHIS